MPTNNFKELADTIIVYMTLGGLGGLAHYLNEVRKGNKFYIGLLVINLFLSSWIGCITGLILPEYISLEVRFGITSMSGFLAFPILILIEAEGPQWISTKLGIGNKLGKKK